MIRAVMTRKLGQFEFIGLMKRGNGQKFWRHVKMGRTTDYSYESFSGLDDLEKHAREQ